METEKYRVFTSIITTPYEEINSDTFEGIIFSKEEQGQILAMKYFGGNIFGILNMLGSSVRCIRTTTRPDTHDFLIGEANHELDLLENRLDEINQLLNLFPKE